MNQRIKELAESALRSSMTHDGVYRPPGFENSVSKEFAEKFAELIVRECALTLESITVVVSESYEDFDNGYNKGLLAGSTVIKQRFGVE